MLELNCNLFGCHLASAKVQPDTRAITTREIRVTPISAEIQRSTKVRLIKLVRLFSELTRQHRANLFSCLSLSVALLSTFEKVFCVLYCTVRMLSAHWLVVQSEELILNTARPLFTH